jgi:peptidyl-prolyl cis-trans isomerase A (cyclophilin A)
MPKNDTGAFMKPLCTSLIMVTVMCLSACGGGEIDTSKPATGMIIETTMGTITCELYPDKAPITVDIIASLAEGTKEWTHPGTGQKMANTPYYDGIVFHRVIPNFMIQTGDPLGQGIGGPGFQFEDEFHESLTFNRSGLLAMANSGPNTNGSQFFITVAKTAHLNFKHTIFGSIVEGQDIADAISKVATAGGNKPRQEISIKHIEIIRGE